MICLAFEGENLQSSTEAFYRKINIIIFNIHLKKLFQEPKVCYFRNQSSGADIWFLEKNQQKHTTTDRHYIQTKRILKRKHSPQKNCSDLKGRTPLVL